MLKQDGKGVVLIAEDPGVITPDVESLRDLLLSNYGTAIRI